MKVDVKLDRVSREQKRQRGDLMDEAYRLPIGLNSFSFAMQILAEPLNFAQFHRFMDRVSRTAAASAYLSVGVLIITIIRIPTVPVSCWSDCGLGNVPVSPAIMPPLVVSL